MARFAPYEPESGRARVAATVRRAVVDDAPRIAAISAEREGLDADAIVDRVRRSLAPGFPRVWVAEVDGEVRGYAKAAWLDAVTEAARGPSHGVRSGWTLTGVVVAPEARRQGLGEALTRARLAWIETNGGVEAFYRVNLANRPSIALHERLGFAELSRDTAYTSMPSTSGESYALCRAPLSPALPLRIGADLDPAAVAALYDAVGWSIYTRDPARLPRALAGSAWVATRWDGDRLVALCRVVSDEASVALVQDLLVHPDHQRRGLGRSLLELALDRYAHCRQVALFTDAGPERERFYAACGLDAVGGMGIVGFMRVR